MKKLLTGLALSGLVLLAQAGVGHLSNQGSWQVFDGRSHGAGSQARWTGRWVANI